MNAWFAGMQVGSGRYVDALYEAWREEWPGDTLARSPRPGPGRGAGRSRLAKLWHEQVAYPIFARGADVGLVPYWAPPAAAPVPLAVTVHDLIPLALPAYRRDWRVRVVARLAAAATRRADAVIADSRHTAMEVMRRLAVAEERITVVPLGVGRRFTSAPRPAEGSAPVSGRYALYLGGYDPRKNVGVLLEAWPAVHAATGVPLVLAGAGAWGGAGPQELVRAAGLPEAMVRVAGPVSEDDAPLWMAGAAVFVFPSIYEGFGLPPLEAMAAGAPTVAADATSLPEVVGDAGLLVPPLDAAAWRAAVIRVLDDPAVAADLSARGRARARRFSWHKTAMATRAVLTRLAPPRWTAMGL